MDDVSPDFWIYSYSKQFHAAPAWSSHISTPFLIESQQKLATPIILDLNIINEEQNIE